VELAVGTDLAALTAGWLGRRGLVGREHGRESTCGTLTHSY
jgi:hypothetical protein